MLQIPDVQKESEGFPKIFIEKVGVENIKVQLPVKVANNNVQYVFANMESYCSLVDNVKGINMSRIGQTIFNVINENKNGFKDLNEFAYELWNVHGNETKFVYVASDFDYLLEQRTPVTNLYSPKDIKVNMTSKYDGQKVKNYLTVKSTEMSLCPCSKEMSLLKNNLEEGELQQINELPKKLRNKILLSGYGAHNQKSEIVVTVQLHDKDSFNVNDIYNIISSCASAPTFSTLKRPDEKWVTEVSYLGGYWDNGEYIDVGGGPKFVEDIVRGIGEKMNNHLDNEIDDYLIYTKNYESIHSENIVASAVISAGRELKNNFSVKGI